MHVRYQRVIGAAVKDSALGNIALAAGVTYTTQNAQFTVTIVCPSLYALLGSALSGMFGTRR